MSLSVVAELGTGCSRLRVGDRVGTLTVWGADAERVTRVDCRSPHEAEVTGTFNLSGSRYPGDSVVEKASDARCEKYFARYVGIDWDSSAYNYDYVTPERSDWRQGDREVFCFAVDPAHPEDSRISLRNVKE